MKEETNGGLNLGEVAALSNVERRIDGRSNRWADESAERIASGADLRQAAREASADWLAALAGWDIYATLTYDPKRWYSDTVPPKPHVATRHLNRFVKAAGNIARRPVFAAGALEETRAGWPHWHALMATGGIDERLFSLISSEWFTHHGFAKFYRVRADTAVPIAAYITKYLVKDGYSVEFASSEAGPWAAVQSTFNLRRV